MNNEYECKAWIDGKLVDVVASYETDYPDILVYGIFTLDDLDTDVTDKVSEEEFDRIYSEISTTAWERMVCSAEDYCQGER